MYDYMIITHIPAFYKINLYNEIAKRKNILVLFISNDTEEKRAQDFVSITSAEFDYQLLNTGKFQTRNKIRTIFKLHQIIKTRRFKKLLVGGWDLLEYWYLVFFVARKHNHLSLESTLVESRVDGIKGLIKKIFLSRIACVYASGRLHTDLLRALNYNRSIKITRGVGIINKTSVDPSPHNNYRKKFLFIGRIAEEKNLDFLIDIFNGLPAYQLTIVGEGNDKQRLASQANENVVFAGAIDNQMLSDVFKQHDILILPSVSEPWGLVVEEALYFGLPVIVSQNCGSSELIDHGQNGFVFSPGDRERLQSLIVNINDKLFTHLVDHTSRRLIDNKDVLQVCCYD